MFFVFFERGLFFCFFERASRRGEENRSEAASTAAWILASAPASRHGMRDG